jgi:hypothetical protein
MTEAVATVPNVYQGALALLERHGWTQEVGEDLRGRICLGEAVERAKRASDDPAVAGSYVFSKFADRLRTAGIITENNLGIVGWNDQPGRTYDEVKNALNVASAQCIAEGVAY